jgi:diguanylate cyclase (GGDEF)-like protein
VTLQAALREKLERCTTLPTLPSVAVRVLQLCQREDLNLGELAGVVTNDPALSAKVLKVVNSPAFGLRQEVRTVSHAVALLGANAVRTLVLSFSLTRDLARAPRWGLKTYWKRSVLGAVAAREVLAERPIPLREEAFLVGLLQDIGMLALQRVLGKAYEDALAEAGTEHDRLMDRELTVFGSDHAEVGAWLLARWRLPERMCMAVAMSHQPELLSPQVTEDLRALVQAVAMSGRIADIWISVDAGQAKSQALKQSEALLPGGEAALDEICGRIVQAVPTVADLFEVDLDGDQMANVLEQAQEALVLASVMAQREVSGTHQALRELEDKAKRLEVESTLDGLTGLGNRRRLDTFVAKEFEIANIQGKPLSVLIADVDFFKKVNDTYGHAAGDAVLRSVAKSMQSCVREHDLVGRWGGEEFLVVLPGAPAQAARAVAERIRKKVAAGEHALGDGRALSVTISVGFATHSPGRFATTKELCESADRALYVAKRGGRNRVEPTSADFLPADAA